MILREFYPPTSRSLSIEEKVPAAVPSAVRKADAIVSEQMTSPFCSMITASNKEPLSFQKAAAFSAPMTKRAVESISESAPSLEITQTLATPFSAGMPSFGERMW